jgi:threonine/homoserine efflux transporter RhtA
VAALMGSLITLCAGTSLAKSLFPFVGAEGTTTYRLIFSTLLLMAFWRPWRRTWNWSEAPILILFGATLGVMNLLFYNALKTVPFGLAIAIEFTGPLAVALWSSKKPLDFVWIVLAVIGMGLILPLGPQGIDNPAALDPVGIAYALGAGVCWALYIVIGQRVADRIGAFATPMGMLVAALVVTPFGIALKRHSLQLGNVFAQTLAQTNLQHLAQLGARRGSLGWMVGVVRATQPATTVRHRLDHGRFDGKRHDRGSARDHKLVGCIKYRCCPRAARCFQ